MRWLIILFLVSCGGTKGNGCPTLPQRATDGGGGTQGPMCQVGSR